MWIKKIKYYQCKLVWVYTEKIWSKKKKTSRMHYKIVRVRSIHSVYIAYSLTIKALCKWSVHCTLGATVLHMLGLFLFWKDI